MKKIKVLHIAQSDGGVAQYLKMYFRYCDSNNFENTLLCSQLYSSQVNDFKKLGVKVYLENMERNIDPIKDLTSIIKIFIKIKKINPDLIYCHSSKAGVIGRIPAIILKIPVIYNSHGWAFNMKNISSRKIELFKIIEKILAKKTDKIIAISEDEYFSAIDNLICTENKIKLIKNGIDINNSSVTESKLEIMKKYNLPLDSLIIGMVARISDQKDPNTFINIAKNIINKYENAYFMYVGDGDMRDIIEQRIIDEGLDKKVFITGWVNKPINYINIFDIALLTSKWEGFGLAILEYMIMGKPVIASSVGGIKNIIKNNETGILVNSGDHDGFSDSIIKIINDSKFKNKLVDNSRNMLIREFDVKNLVKEHECLISSLIKEGNYENKI